MKKVFKAQSSTHVEKRWLEDTDPLEEGWFLTIQEALDAERNEGSQDVRRNAPEGGVGGESGEDSPVEDGEVAENGEEA